MATESIPAPAVDQKPRSQLAVFSLCVGVVSFLGMIAYAGSGVGPLLFLSLAGSAVTLVAALLGVGEVVLRRFRCRGLGLAVAAGCFGLISPLLSVGFG